MLDKIYKIEEKFNSIDYNFNLKVIIFYNKYRQIALLSNVYIYSTSIMFVD